MGRQHRNWNFLQFENFCQLTRCLQRPVTINDHFLMWSWKHLATAFLRFKNSNSTNSLHLIYYGTQISEAWTPFFSALPGSRPSSPPPPSLKRAKTTAQQVGRQNRPPLFTFVLSAPYWGDWKPHKALEGSGAPAPAIPPSKTQSSRTKHFRQSIFTLKATNGRLLHFPFPFPCERIC